MRFARQTSIFRGPLDAAPVVCVLFLLVIFVLLGSIVYTPGVLVKFESFGSSPDTNYVLTITRDNDILFAGKTNKPSELEQLREGDLRNVPPNESIQLNVEPGADPKIVQQVRELFQVRLPTNGVANLTATDNPTVVVAVNFRGQCFFENRPVGDRELKQVLRDRLRETAGGTRKLTMVLWADKAAENDVVMRLYQLAREAGITEFLLAEQPSVFGASGERLRR